MALPAVGVALEALNKSIQAIKNLRNIDLKMQAAEYKDVLADLLADMTELKIQLLNLQEENLELRKIISGEDKKTELKKALKKDAQGWCQLSTEIQGHAPGIYCNFCFEKEEKLFLLQYHESASFGRSYYCLNCKNTHFLS